MTEPNDSNELAAEDEFAGLSPAPPRRSPVLALAMIGLAAFTVFHLQKDLRYSMSDKAPVSLKGETSPTSLVGRYVSVSGIPGRRDSLYVESRGGHGRETLFRLLDFTPPLFVRANATVEHVNTSGTWTGRLERFSDVGWASSIRDYYKSTPQKALRALDLAQLRMGCDDCDEHRKRDRRGVPVQIGNDQEITFHFKPTDYAIYLSRDKYPKKEDAQHELERILAQRPKVKYEGSPLGGSLGKDGLGTDAEKVLDSLNGEPPLPASKLTAGEDTSDAFVFFLPLEKDPAAQNALMATIERASQTSTPIDMELHSRVTKVPFKSLGSVKWDEVTEATIEEPVQIDDALVLVEGEAPRDYTWTVFVVALLCTLAAWNVWYLARPRRA